MIRSAIIRGPAKITYRSQVFWSQGDIELNLSLETFEINTSAHGKVDERAKEVQAQVSFVPSGEWEGLAVLFPYMSNQAGAITVIGSEIFTAADGSAGDSPLEIHTLAGTKYTFAAAAVTKMPDIILSATKTLLGSVQFTCVRADGVAWTTDESLYEIDESAGAPSSSTDFVPANIITQPYPCTWASPLASFQTKEGVVVSFDTGFDTVETDAAGQVGMTLRNVGVMARCMPVGVTEANVLSALKLQGTGNARGRSLLAGASDFVATGTGVVVTVKKAAIKQAGFKFGSTVLRVGELGFAAQRAFPSGVAAPLFSVATS